MASERLSKTTDAPTGKPASPFRIPAPQRPIPSALLSEGPELLRDSHC